MDHFSASIHQASYKASALAFRALYVSLLSVYQPQEQQVEADQALFSSRPDVAALWWQKQRVRGV